MWKEIVQNIEETKYSKSCLERGICFVRINNYAVHYFPSSDSVDPTTEELHVSIVDSALIGQGFVYGETKIPLSTFSKTNETEDWFPIYSVQKKTLTGPATTGLVFLKIVLSQS